MKGFEPSTSYSRSKRSAKLSYTLMIRKYGAAEEFGFRHFVINTRC